MSILGSGSVHVSQRFKKKLAPSSSAHNATCQKCLEVGHWTYECKNPPAYRRRPTRTEQLLNPKVKPKFMDPSELLPEDKEKPAEGKKGEKKNKAKKAATSSSDSDTSSSSNSDSSSSSGSSDSDSSSSSDSGSSSFESSSSGSDSSSSSDSDSSSSSGSSSSDDDSSDNDLPATKRAAKKHSAANERAMPAAVRAEERAPVRNKGTVRDEKDVRTKRRPDVTETNRGASPVAVVEDGRWEMQNGSPDDVRRAKRTYGEERRRGQEGSASGHRAKRSRN